MVDVGTPAPDFAAVDTEGRPVRLSDLWTRQTLVVVFLRHLGCTFCRQHIVSLKKHYPDIQAAGADVVCVAMGGPKVGKAYKITFELPYTILMVGDNDPSVYRLYGLGRGSLGQLLGPRMLIAGFRAIFQLGARSIGRIVGDGRQLSGTFIVERGGVVRLAYRGKDAADNPPIQLLLANLATPQVGGLAFGDESSLEPADASHS